VTNKLTPWNIVPFFWGGGSQQFLSYSNFPHFMEQDSALMHSQEPVTSPYPELIGPCPQLKDSLQNWTTHARVSVSHKKFFSSTVWALTVLYPCLRWPGRVTDLSPPSSVEVKNEWGLMSASIHSWLAQGQFCVTGSIRQQNLPCCTTRKYVFAHSSLCHIIYFPSVNPYRIT